MTSVQTLEHRSALAALGAVQAELERAGEGAAVAVVDAHGELIAFVRTDGCRLPSIQIAINKAYAAAREQSESSELGTRSRAEEWPLTNFGELRYPGWGGGVPVERSGEVIGAVGVSGLPESRDVELARLGADVAARPIS